MRIIPAIDIIDGKCVRLSRGKYDTKKIYNENPVVVAKSFEDHGISYLHLVDLDGAKAGNIVNHNVLYEIASKTNLKIDFGGGLKTDRDIGIAFENGAQQITGGSIAVKEPEVFNEWLVKYGSEKIILGADFHPTPTGNKIAVSGWEQQSNEELVPFIAKYQNNGIQYVICTDISKDGMLMGPGTDIYSTILKGLPGIKLIASGGVSSIDDIAELATIGCEGVIIGKAIYEGTITLKQLQEYAY